MKIGAISAQMPAKSNFEGIKKSNDFEEFTPDNSSKKKKVIIGVAAAATAAAAIAAIAIKNKPVNVHDFVKKGGRFDTINDIPVAVIKKGSKMDGFSGKILFADGDVPEKIGFKKGIPVSAIKSSPQKELDNYDAIFNNFPGGFIKVVADGKTDSASELGSREIHERLWRALDKAGVGMSS